jgi:hypothetical protein
MRVEQGLNVLRQAMNIAVGAGTFKTTEDVATINEALTCITNVLDTNAEVVTGIKVKK